MDKIKKIIVILAILILILIGIIFAISEIINMEEIPDSMGNVDPVENEENIIRIVADDNEFYSVKKCVEKYYVTTKNLWYDNGTSQIYAEGEALETGIKMDKFSAQYLCDILGSKYLEENNITIESIGNAYTQVNSMKTIINNMYSYNLSKNVRAYFVKGYNWEYKTSSKKDIVLMVVVDEQNACFAIYPSEYIAKQNLNKIEVGKPLDINAENFAVSKNENNKFVKEVIDETLIIQEYVDLYKFNTMYDKESAYNSLDEEYRNNKFGNFDEYKNYLKNNTKTIKLNSYTTSKVENCTQYICKTIDGKYFIITEKSPMNYSIMLDSYTCDLPDFVRKYNKLSEERKVGMNLEKIKLALNEKDYKYVYKKLNETFRQNNYPTLEVFEDYIKSNLFENNSFEYGEVKNENGAYVCTVTARRAMTEATQGNEIKVIMQLLEGTDFQITFAK